MTIDKTIDKIEKEITTLEDALKSGVVMLKSEVDKTISEALENAKKEMHAQWRKEMNAEDKKKRMTAMAKGAGSFIDGTGITDVKFGERLKKMNVQKDYLTCLRNEHKQMTDQKIWDYIRKNYRPPKQ